MSDEPKARVQHLRDAELALEDQLAAAKIDLVSARSREADAALASILDGGSGKGEGGEGAAVIGERIGTLKTAIGQARQKRAAAIRAVWATESEAVHTSTGDLRATAAAHMERVRDLLRQLEEIEGCPYMPDGRVYLDGDLGGVRVVDHSAYKTPLSRRLQIQIETQDRQAAELTSREVSMSGDVSATSRDELVAIVRASNAFTIAPALHDLLDWCEEAEAASRARLARRGMPIEGPAPEDPSTLEYTYTLVWRGGEIVAKASTIQAFRHQSVYLAGSGRTVDKLVNVA